MGPRPYRPRKPPTDPDYIKRKIPMKKPKPKAAGGEVPKDSESKATSVTPKPMPEMNGSADGNPEIMIPPPVKVTPDSRPSPKSSTKRWTTSTGSGSASSVATSSTGIMSSGSSAELNRSSASTLGVNNMWTEYCYAMEDLANIAPVNIFTHAPFARNWEKFAKEGVMVELPNPYSFSPRLDDDQDDSDTDDEVVALNSDSDGVIELDSNSDEVIVVDSDSNESSGDDSVTDDDDDQVFDWKKMTWWFGEVKQFAGYRALIEFLNEDEDESQEITQVWISFFSDIPKHIGFCREMKNYVKLQSLSEDTPVRSDDLWEDLKESLSMKDTISRSHYSEVCDELASNSSRFTRNQIVEALDREDCSQYRLAQVMEKIGDRVRIAYCDTVGTDDPGFWFSQHSVSVMELGWCNTIGVELKGLKGRSKTDNFPFPTLDISTLPKTPNGLEIREGMIFEMRHPVFTYKIVPGYVVKVLKHGYFVAGTDWTREDTLVEMILHITSDYLLPINFCRDHGIHLYPPKDGPPIKHNQFSWSRYVEYTKSEVLKVDLVQRPKNEFKKGHKLESAKLIQPKYIRPATVTQVAGHLIKLHFDGYDRETKTAFQWVSCESTEIYPAGYAEMVGCATKGKPCRTLLCVDRPPRRKKYVEDKVSPENSAML